MATITAADVSQVFSPTIWTREVERAREAKLVMASRVRRKDADVMKFGEKIEIPFISNLPSFTVGPDGSFTPLAPVETKVSVNITRWLASSVDIADIVEAQSQYDLQREYTEKIGTALGYAVEDDLLGLWSGFSQATTLAADVTDPIIVRAIQYLDEADAPLTDRFMIFRPSQKAALLKIDKYVNIISGNNNTGMAKAGRNMVQSGVASAFEFGQIYGIPVLYNTRVIFTGGESKNLLWQRDAMALALQKRPKIETMARTKLSTTVVGSELYGFAELRDSHAVVMPTSN